jgi:hypothetical protein
MTVAGKIESPTIWPAAGASMAKLEQHEPKIVAPDAEPQSTPASTCRNRDTTYSRNLHTLVPLPIRYGSVCVTATSSLAFFEFRLWTQFIGMFELIHKRIVLSTMDANVKLLHTGSVSIMTPALSKDNAWPIDFVI